MEEDLTDLFPRKPPTMGEVFDRLCPQYLSFGMSLTEYWDKDPALAKWYREKHRIEEERFSFHAWLEGSYFYNAVSSALGQAFGGTAKYLQEPIRITPMTKEEREEEARLARVRLIKRLEAMGGKGLSEEDFEE